MHARFFDNVFIEEIGAGGHQRHRVECAASKMRRIGRMRCGAVKAPGSLNICERTDVKHSGKCLRMPGYRSVHIVKQSLAHHKGFAGTAFFTGTAVKTHGSTAAVLRQPLFYRDGACQRGGAQEIMPATMTVSTGAIGLLRGAMRVLTQSG
ncbi:hypothetical protein D3C78_1158700 [compost metagenome]